MKTFAEMGLADVSREVMRFEYLLAKTEHLPVVPMNKFSKKLCDTLQEGHHRIDNDSHAVVGVMVPLGDYVELIRLKKLHDDQKLKTLNALAFDTHL